MQRDDTSINPNPTTTTPTTATSTPTATTAGVPDASHLPGSEKISFPHCLFDPQQQSVSQSLFQNVSFPAWPNPIPKTLDSDTKSQSASHPLQLSDRGCYTAHCEVCESKELELNDAKNEIDEKSATIVKTEKKLEEAESELQQLKKKVHSQSEQLKEKNKNIATLKNKAATSENEKKSTKENHTKKITNLENKNKHSVKQLEEIKTELKNERFKHKKLIEHKAKKMNPKETQTK